MVAILYRMAAGIPGDVNRFAQGTTIEPGYVDPTNPPAAYGVPVTVNSASGGFRTILTSDQGTPPFNVSLVVRPYPLNAPTASQFFGQQPLGAAQAPPTVGTIEVLERGYMTVLLSGTAAAARGKPVFIWAAAASGSHVLGGFEAAATGGSTITTPAYFMGAADSNGNVEIAWNI